jgi:hypothetical protein
MEETDKGNVANRETRSLVLDSSDQIILVDLALSASRNKVREEVRLGRACRGVRSHDADESVLAEHAFAVKMR